MRFPLPPAVCLGQVVAYLHQPLGFESKELQAMFIRPIHSELFTITPGEVLWLRRELIHDKGEVHGYTPQQVKSITPTRGRHRQATIVYEAAGKYSEGQLEITRPPAILAVVRNFRRLCELLEAHPMAIMP